MGTRSKLQKVKKKLKKAKIKIKSLESKNTDLLKQLGIEPKSVASGETATSETRKPTNGSPLSKEMNAKEVVALFQTMNDPEEIQKFTKGDKRPTVVQRAKSRIRALTKALNS